MTALWWAAIFLGCLISFLRLGSQTMREWIRRGGLVVMPLFFWPILFACSKLTELCLFTVGTLAYLWNASFGVFPQKKPTAKELNELVRQISEQENATKSEGD